MTSRRARIEAALTAALGPSAHEPRVEPARGGCINTAATVTFAGERFFAKWNDHAVPGQFACEAAGLAAMRASGAELAIPEPVASADDGPGRSFLVLRFVEQGRAGPGYDEAMGRGLAALHRTTDPRGFGFMQSGACGATPQPNPWTADWIEFYRDHRLGHQLRLAASNGMGAEALRRGDRLLERLSEVLARDPEPSALIHGDLWSGNAFADSRGRPGVLDPAAYFAHREAELGMMRLFGGFSERVYAAYDEAFPLASGWEDRLPLYTLYHVLNHFNLFGGGYASQADRIMRRYV